MEKNEMLVRFCRIDRMDKRMLGALVSSIVCEVAILILLLTHSPSPCGGCYFPLKSVWPILVEIFQSSEAVAAAMNRGSRRTRSNSEDGRKPKSNSCKRRRLMLTLPSPSPPPSPTYLNGMMGAASFKDNFKMSAATFEWLCAEVEKEKEKENEKEKVNLRVGMAVLRLASGCSYANVAQRFASTEAEARRCTQRLCRLLCTRFRHWVSYPTPAVLRSVSDEFQTLSGGLPNCCGAIDCTRFRFKGAHQYSVAAQIVADSCGRILSITTGLSGDKGDARVLRSSSLFADVEQGRLLNSETVKMKGVAVPQYLVGDGGYPLLPWLMVPFADPLEASCQEDFNAKLLVMRKPALRTIACLSSWGILSKPIEDEDVRGGVACIGACAILHNLVLFREDGFDTSIQDCSLRDYSSQYYRDASREESLIEHKASLVRNALALHARDITTSFH
ncbi:hypothetical protein SUGI_0741590 [Cryptomeria japonica]|uniref:protein ALP1-like n=1 Tax=Cryptomeria japonica TaxID=3369 RepID=UPI0024149142|nr:protein ALP1-like [Cryptomeria japonica]XP_057856318.2 protein ALP1-like [Cryptomeria japonica]GLJ36781.1 hypothetical protein SUGI_0741590 [Cryptomeria japonica]